MKEIKKPEKKLVFPIKRPNEYFNKGFNQCWEQFNTYHNQEMKQGINSELLEAAEGAKINLTNGNFRYGACLRKTDIALLMSIVVTLKHAIKNAEKLPKRLSVEEMKDAIFLIVKELARDGVYKGHKQVDIYTTKIALELHKRGV